MLMFGRSLKLIMLTVMTPVAVFFLMLASGCGGNAGVRTGTSKIVANKPSPTTPVANNCASAPGVIPKTAPGVPMIVEFYRDT